MCLFTLTGTDIVHNFGRKMEKLPKVLPFSASCVIIDTVRKGLKFITFYERMSR